MKADFEPLTKLLKELLSDKVEKVNVSDRLADSPCVPTTTGYGWSAIMERIMQAQALSDNLMISYMYPKKTAEVNPTHSTFDQFAQKGVGRLSGKMMKDLI